MTRPRLLLIIACSLILFFLPGVVSCAEPLDSDGDGWSDSQETRAGTNPDSVDTDNDGYWDPYDSNPLNAEIHGEAVVTEPGIEPSATTAPADTTPSTTSEAPSPSAEASLLSPEAAAAGELRKVQDAVKVMMINMRLVIRDYPMVTTVNRFVHLYAKDIHDIRMPRRRSDLAKVPAETSKGIDDLLVTRPDPVGP